jgi:hypothetical protein
MRFMTPLGPYPRRSAVRLTTLSTPRPPLLSSAPSVRPGPGMPEVVLLESVTMVRDTSEDSQAGRERDGGCSGAFMVVERQQGGSGAWGHEVAHTAFEGGASTVGYRI